MGLRALEAIDYKKHTHVMQFVRATIKNFNLKARLDS